MAEVRLEVELPHPPELVWRALTEPRLLREWFMPTDLVAREGAEFTLEPGTLPGFLGPVSAEVTELVPPERIVMRWQGERLHTRVAWEITRSWASSKLLVLQTGFIGAPATLRRRALRDTYARLFAEQLPATLDRLAALAEEARDDAAVAAGRPVTTAVTVPRQRRPPANLPTGAWRTGRSLATSASAGAAAAAIPGPRKPADDRVSGEPGGAAEPPAGDPAVRRPAWPGWLAVAPGWARALVVGAAAAALAMVVLAAIVNVPGVPMIGEGVDAGTGPTVAGDAGTQPGGTEPPGSPAEESGGSDGTDDSGGADGSAGTGEDGVDAASGPDPTAPPAPEEAGGRGTAPGPGAPRPPDASPTPPPPVLTAQLTATDRLLLGLGGYAVTVTVTNPGPGTATGWEVRVDVAGQDVTNVVGAEYAEDGTEALFTPVDAELAAGASTQFSFDLPGLLAQRPGGCTIDGNPCG
ncbi:MAG TPA: SRPBCC domain-containing protein [Natronosporangium sp.]